MFASREDAGCRLGDYLAQRRIRADIALGLPRGGVVVAAQVARILRIPLDVLVVRKIGHPFYREFAVGALAEEDVAVLDEQALGSNPSVQQDLDRIVHEERERLREYERKFHRGKRPCLEGKAVLIVDDGLATGATTEAAALSARKQKAESVLLAAPVASTSAMERLQRVSDAVLVPLVDPDFNAVGSYYEVFGQTTDSEVLDLLKAA